MQKFEICKYTGYIVNRQARVKKKNNNEYTAITCKSDNAKIN